MALDGAPFGDFKFLQAGQRSGQLMVCLVVMIFFSSDQIGHVHLASFPVGTVQDDVGPIQDCMSQ
jgi:hypothetical protein